MSERDFVPENNGEVIELEIEASQEVLVLYKGLERYRANMGRLENNLRILNGRFEQAK